MSDFKDLKTWQKAHKMALETHRVACKIRGSGHSGVRKQMIDAALSVPTNIVESRGQITHREECRYLRMAAGIPLTDDDRASWLSALAARIREAHDAGAGLVVTCSALKRSYRDILRAAAPELRFIFLNGQRLVISERLAERRGHFMPASLLDSQLATLEEPAVDERAWAYDISESAQDIVDDIVTRTSA